jgi:hypothetical protein
VASFRKSKFAPSAEGAALPGPGKSQSLSNKRPSKIESSPYREAASVLTAIVIVELRHIVQAVSDQFANCHNVWDVLIRLWTADEITFVGIVGLIFIAYFKLREYWGRFTDPKSKTRRRLVAIIGAALLAALACCGGVVYVAPSLQSAAAPPPTAKHKPWLVTCFHADSCRSP